MSWIILYSSQIIGIDLILHCFSMFDDFLWLELHIDALGYFYRLRTPKFLSTRPTEYNRVFRLQIYSANIVLNV